MGLPPSIEQLRLGWMKVGHGMDSEHSQLHDGTNLASCSHCFKTMVNKFTTNVRHSTTLATYAPKSGLEEV